jgi:hypothetical protein
MDILHYGLLALKCQFLENGHCQVKPKTVKGQIVTT